jgi:DNA-binding XRE family transcriptional regulator
MIDERPALRTEIAERFKALRRDAFLTQEAMAAAVGLCQQTISEIENCHVMIWPSTWRKFAVMERLFRQGRIDPYADWCDYRRFGLR